MIENKAPDYDNVVSDLEDSQMTRDVRKVNGNTVTCRFKENSYGSFDPPAYPYWHLTTIRRTPNEIEIVMSYIR